MASASVSDGIRRAAAQAGRQLGASGVSVRTAPPAARIVLRASSDGVSALSSALGIDLAGAINTGATATGRHALRLGPDEWLLIDETGQDPGDACAGAQALHSAVDVSHRNVAFLIEGEGAEEVLAAGCPLDLDLSAFPVGTATRTVFGKIEIVLYRSGPDSFRMECWRSYSDYAFDFLASALADR
jgi:sarcosine oxidase, subunit gamma